jgi:hypothetical protein
MMRQIEVDALHAGQQRIVDESRRFNVLECGRRFGKTALGKHLAIDTAINGKPVGWFAPTYKYLAEVWNDIERIVRPVTEKSNAQEKSIRLVTGGVLDFWSLETPDAGRGRKYQRAIIDEASVVRNLQECWLAAIRPTLTDLRGDAWFLGTPKGRNFFHQMFGKGESAAGEWKSWRMGTVDNPHMRPSEIEAARRDLPTDIFEQEYLGIPADDGGNPFGMDAIARCVAPISTAPPAVWGIDLAKSQDWTVCIALDSTGVVCAVHRWQGPWESTLVRVRALVGNTYALVDSTGVGDPVLEALQRGGGQYEGFKFSAPSKQQLMEGLVVAIQQCVVRFPAGDIQRELETFEYEYTKTGVRYSAPTGLHDDCVCALALAVHGWQQRSGLIAPPLGTTRESPWRM